MMTNYPAHHAQSWQEMSFLEWLHQFRLAIEMADWDPRQWALYHDECFDLPSAWWAAGHTIEFAREVAVCGGLHQYLASSCDDGIPMYLWSDDHGT